MAQFGLALATLALVACASSEQPQTPDVSRSAAATGSSSATEPAAKATNIAMATPTATNTVTASPTPRPLPNDLPTPPGSYIFAGGSQYGIASLDITFTVWQEGWVSWGPGVVTERPDIRDEVGMGFADVANIYVDPCQWRTKGQRLPAVGQSVEDLADALAAQPRFTASSIKDVTLAGYTGSYIELTLDPDLDFSSCDGYEVHSWIDVKGNSRYYQGGGQVEQFWILDVDGTRLVIEGSFFPHASLADRDDLARIINSISIVSR